jgi:serine protease inhibitor
MGTPPQAGTTLGWLTVAATLFACGDPVGVDVDPITELPRNLSMAEREVIERSSDFGLRLLRETVVRDDRPNVVLSPLSASMALGMTLNGADGETFNAMRSTLDFGSLSQEEINEAYSGLIELLTTLDPTVRFDIANAIWTLEGTPFHQAFLDALSEAFDATTEAVDFADPATLEAINAWVDENTDGKIEKIVEELGPNLVALLVNAIYFEGAWTTEFDPADTRRQAFTLLDGSSVQVDMMSIANEEFALGAGAGYQAAELPYGGGAYTMVVVVPHDSPRDFIAGLDPARWSEILGSLSPTEVDALALPKFTIAYDTYLNEALKAMGMDVAFRPGADFSRMSPTGDRLCIDFVRQKTFVEVDERGTRAAAVTAVGIGEVSFTGLIVDRPFVFAIRERLSGTILFVGLVGDPTHEESGAGTYTSECS